MANTLILGVPADVMNLVQDGTIERTFQDALFPNLSYRQEAVYEEWPANTGVEYIVTRAGLLVPVTKPLKPGQDPLPVNVPFEQWVATLAQYGSAIDTHMPTSTVINVNLLLRNIQGLGVQAGQSVNRIARNELFKAYLGGSTVARLAIASADTAIPVASLNGFSDVVLPNVSGRPFPVSQARALPITIGTGGTAVKRNVIGVVPDDSEDPWGPGTLILSQSVGTNFAGLRTPITSAYAPKIVRASGGASVDAIGAADSLVMMNAINAAAQLRNANVPPHEDGTFHAHISAISESQIFNDPVFQRLQQSLPDGAFKTGYIGTIGGVSFFNNNEAPTTQNMTEGVVLTGSGVGAGQLGIYGRDIGAEVVNGNGIAIGRTIITGKGAIMERRLDESAYTTEAGLTGTVGEFTSVQNGVTINTEGIRLIMRAPLDRLQQVVSAAWSISTSFAPPSDVTAASGPERFKRAIVIEHSLGAV